MQKLPQNLTSKKRKTGFLYKSLCRSVHPSIGNALVLHVLFALPPLPQLNVTNYPVPHCSVLKDCLLTFKPRSRNFLNPPFFSSHEYQPPRYKYFFNMKILREKNRKKSFSSRKNIVITGMFFGILTSGLHD